MLKRLITSKFLRMAVLTAVMGGMAPFIMLAIFSVIYNSYLSPGYTYFFLAVSMAGFLVVLAVKKRLGRVSWRVLGFAGWAALVMVVGALELRHFTPDPVRFWSGDVSAAEFSRTNFAPVTNLRVEIADETRPCLGLPPNSIISQAIEVPAGAFLTYGTAIRRSAQDPGTSRLEVLIRDDRGQTQKLETVEFPKETPRWSDHALDLSSLAGRPAQLIFQVRSLNAPPKSGSPPTLVLVSHPRLIRADPGRPNIIWIVLDALRADHVSFDPQAPGLTPRLAGLAARGTAFTRHYAQCSWTSPSVASLLTGTMPIQTGAISYQRLKLESKEETAAEILSRAGWQTAAMSGNLIIGPDFLFDRGFDGFEKVMPQPYFCWRAGGKLTQRARDWIHNHRGLPFFLYLHYMDAHAPYLPPPEYLSFRGEDKISVRELAKAVTTWGPIALINHPELEAAASYHRLYRGEIRYLDSCLGQLFDALEQEGLLDNTIIIIVADHGEEFGDHGLLSHGTSLFEELLRVPLIIYDGRRPQPGPKLISAATTNLDLLPTLMDTLGLAMGPDRLGRSLLPLIQGQTNLPPETVFAELPQVENYDARGQFRKGLKDSYLRAMIKGPIKLITATDFKTKGVIVEIYDLANDPHEKNNLALHGPRDFESAREEMDAFFKNLPFALDPAEVYKQSPETARFLKALGYIR